MTTGLGLLGVNFWDPQPDIPSITQDRRFPDLQGHAALSFQFQGVELWHLHWGWQNFNFQVDSLACSKTYTTGQQLQQGGYNRFVAPLQTYGVDDLGASDEELADSPTGSCLCPSLR